MAFVIEEVKNSDVGEKTAFSPFSNIFFFYSIFLGNYAMCLTRVVNLVEEKNENAGCRHFLRF